MSKKQIEVTFRGTKTLELLSSILIRVVRDHLVDGDVYLFAFITLANLYMDMKKYEEDGENAKNDLPNV